jgi:hypothetical protein
MKITVYFDLGTLSDRVLNLLLRGSSEVERPPGLVSEIADKITAELLMRQSSAAWPSRKYFEIDSGIEPGDVEAIADAVQNLLSDILELERAARKIITFDLVHTITVRFRIVDPENGKEIVEFHEWKSDDMAEKTDDRLWEMVRQLSRGQL